MANGVQLATAYISLNVRTDDIKKQVSSALNGVGSQGRQVGQSIGSKIAEGIRGHFGGGLALSMFNPLEIAGVRWAVRAGAAIGGALKKAIIGTIGGLGLGAIFGAGGVLTAGLDRLKTLQQSTVQLSLKLSPEEIRSLQKQISDVVTGTPIPLDKAMQAVPKAVQAGMRGDAVKQYIKDIADLTASTGGQAQFDQLAMIMEQIRSKTKLAGDEMMQLNEAGVDVRGLLKQGMGWDDKTLNQKLKSNKVGLQELQKSIQKVYGEVDAGNGRKGLAQKMGQTFDGAIGSLKASASRLGANLISAILGKKADEDPLRDFALGLNKITDGLNGMGRWVDAHRTDIHNVFVKGRDLALGFGRGVKSVWEWLGKAKDKVTEFGNWFSTTWDKAGNSVTNLTTKVKTKFDEIKTKISDIVDDLKGKFDGIFGPEGWFAQQFDKLGNLVDKVRGVLGLGEATATAAGTTGFNPGPMAPNRFGNYPSRAGLAPGTRLDGSDQKIAGSGAARAAAASGNQKVLNFDQSITGQKFSWDCGPGSAQIILNGRSVIKSEEQLIAEMGTTQAGTNFGGGNISGSLNKALPGANYSEIQGGGVSTDQFFNDVARSVSAGYGAMLNWNTSGMGAGGPKPMGIKGTTATPYNEGDIAHYVAVMGVDPKDQSMLIADPKDGREYWISAENAAELMRQRGYVAANPGMASGGGIRGAGTGTSDSIPAWLSNGEHVLTAKDVQAMGGQQGVYAFRNALHRAGGGAIPGFAPGGAVDPSVIQDAQDNIADLNKQNEIAQAQFNELMQNGDASPAQILQAQQQIAQTKRALDNAVADLPMIMAGQSPPDRSKQNSIYNLTDQLATAQQTLADQQAAGDAPLSQQLQAQYGVQSAKRERDQAIAAAQGQNGTDYGQEFVRSLGFIPASAGNTGVAGTSSLAQFIGMGNDIVGGLIDTGTSLAQTAVSAAITTGLAGSTFGGGAAAAPFANAAANYGIQLLGNQAKRLSAYGFQMAGIGADALMEQLSPFGMPRWLGYDYANFMPQIGIQEAALSTVEKLGADAINKQMGSTGVNVPPEPRAPDAGVNTAPSGPSAATSSPPAPWLGGAGDFPRPLTSLETIDKTIGQNPALTNPFDPRNGGGGGGGGNGGGGSWARGGHVGIYDNGGILRPGELAFNASRTPEGILTKQQWEAMMTTAATKPSKDAPLVGNLYAQDMQDAIRQLEKVKRRDMMQYSGRP